MQYIWKSLLRRKKEFQNAAFVTFIAAFFMTGMLMLQQVMNDYVRSMNLSYYGNWVVASTDGDISHPYLGKVGSMGTSANVLDQENIPQDIQIGSISAELASFGGISLYEGCLPQNNDEMAADIYALSALGYSYEIGQSISLTVLVQAADAEKGLEEITETRTYTLTGTIKSFSNQWMTPPVGSIPEIILTDEEVTSIADTQHIWYYELNSSYQDVDIKLLAQAIIADHPSTVFNAYVYENLLWGNVTSLVWVALLMIVISVFALGFVISSYSARRLPAYYRLRSLGASRRQLNRMIACECAAITVPFAAAGIAAAYLVVALVCRFIASSAKIPYFFHFRIGFFGLQLAAAVATILSGILTAIAQTRDRRLTAGMTQGNNKRFQKLRRVAKKCAPEKTLLKRQRMLHPLSSVLQGCFEILAVGFLCLCLAPVLDAALTQVAEYKTTHDVEMMAMAGMNNESSPYSGLSQAELDELSQISGVKRIEKQITDSTHYIYWDTIEDSMLIQDANSKRGTFPDADSTKWARNYTNIKCVDDFSTVEQAIKMGGETASASKEIASFDWASYEKGEQIVLIVSHEMIDTTDGSRYVVEDDSLQGSIEITFAAPLKGDLLTVPAYIVHVGMNNEEVGAFLGTPYTVYASQALMERLAAIEGKELCADYVELWLNEFASYEATDKVLADFATKRGLVCFNYAEQNRKMLIEDIVRPICIYGGLAIMTLIIFLVLEMGFLQSHIRRSRKGMQLLYRLGANNRQIRHQVLRETFQLNLWYLAGLLPGFGLIYYWCWQKVELERVTTMEYQGNYSILLNEITQRSDVLALEKALFHSHLWLIVIVVAALLIGMTCYETVRSCRAFQKGESKKGEREI